MNQFIKGLVVGGVLVASGFGLAVKSQPDLSASVPGRFQLCQSSHLARDKYLVDTARGAVWQGVQDIHSGNIFWKMLYVEPRLTQSSDAPKFVIPEPAPFKPGDYSQIPDIDVQTK